MTVFLIIVVASVFFAALVWILVSAMRILHPEQPVPRGKDPDAIRRNRIRSGEIIMVGFQDIREYIHQESRNDRSGMDIVYESDDDYDYSGGASSGLPLCWYRDLSIRRN